MEDFEKTFNELKKNFDELNKVLNSDDFFIDLCTIKIKFNPFSSQILTNFKGTSPLQRGDDKNERYKELMNGIAALYTDKIEEEIGKLVSKFLKDIIKDNIDVLDEKK